MNSKLYVGCLPYSTNEDSLREYFSGAGTVSSVSIITDRETGRSRGFGFVEMSTDDEAQAAIDMFDGVDFEGRKLTVNIARPKQSE
jgi:RNA recognition motif-containing protein